MPQSERITPADVRPARTVIWLLGAVGIGLLVGCGAGRSEGVPGGAAERPNIVVILADDMGYSDVGSYGGEIRTPNLDRLARDGLRFTQFYNTARCVPTRAALLAGLYPHQSGLGAMVRDQGLPGYRGFLTDNAVTVAEVLREAGYQTGMVGKWHLSNNPQRPDREEQLAWLAHQVDYGDFSPREQYPTAHGFDDYFGNIWGVVDFFDPFSLVNGEEPVRSVPPTYFHTDAINDTAAAYVERYARQDAPFFLYVAHTAPHWPLHAHPEDIARYDDTYTGGWQAIREARYRRMLELAIIDGDDGALAPRIEPELSWEANPDRVWDARAMAVHAAMVDRMDQGIGRLIRKLEETGELENTLILFLSDNGASPERPSVDYNGPGYDRPGSTRDGREVIYPARKEALAGPQTVFAALGPRWANVSNTPFRWWKARTHEGGIATPLIVHWPRGIGVERGSITEQPGHVIDIMATALDVAGVAYPANYRGRDTTPLEGKTLLPILRNGEREGHEALFWEHLGAAAVRDGDWKLVKVGRDDPWELYNLDDDRTELNDLASRYPERVLAMERMWTAWAERSQVLPKP